VRNKNQGIFKLNFKQYDMKINYDIDEYWLKQKMTLEDLIAIRDINFKHEPEISVVESIYSKEVFAADPELVFDGIRNGEFKDPILKIRQTDDLEEKRKLKMLLPSIIFGATFNGGRKNIKEASNLICLDFDHVDDLERIIFRLRFHRYIYGMFISPSGDGLKVIVRTDVEDEAAYKKVASQLIKYFADLGLIADPSKHNINDLCFFSYDPNALYNPEATIWRQIIYTEKEQEPGESDSITRSVEYIIQQIEEQKKDITANYDEWLKICFALSDQFGEDGRQYFHQISQFYEKYNESECDQKFDSCLNSSKTGVTIKTFFMIARDNGFNLPVAPINPTIIPDPFDQEFYTGEELLIRSINQLPTLVDPILPKVGLVALGGSSDVGKSTFLRHLAINISSGKEKFLEFPINAKHNRVIYVSTEDDDSALAYLLDLQNKALNMPSLSYKKLIFIFDSTNLLEKLEKRLKATPADLVIIDTFLDLYPGEMNQANKIRSFLHNFAILAKKYQCLVMMLHHTGKRTEELPPSKNNLLGSQGFEAKMRLVLELRLDRDNPELRHLCVVKANYLSKEYKNSSYALRFDSNMLFENTGLRVPFDDLIGTKKDRETFKQEWIEIAKPLIEEGKTYQEVSEALKQRGYNVSKSTIQREIPKN
jgi:hypothetical protein